MLTTLYKQLVMALRCAFPAVASPRAASLTVTLLTALTMANAHAIGLGQVSVQSALGQPLRATIPLLGAGGVRPPSTCFSAHLSSADGAFIVAPRITLTPSTATAGINLSSSISIAEPALTLMVEMSCGEVMQREFFLLLDPPMSPTSTPLVPLMPLGVPSNGSAAARSTRERIVAPAGATAAETPPAVIKPKRPPAVIAAAPLAVQPKPATPKENAAAARNVLRLSSRDGSDVELMNAIGLRLARANSLTERSMPAGAVAIPDLAMSADTRAARARFAALLRDDGKADANAAATDQKLQDLQAKMLILESETLRLKQLSQRDAAALNAARGATPADVFGSNWVSILAALLVLAGGAIVWLLLRIKHLKQHNMTWNWEENVAAAGTDTDTAHAADDHGKQEPAPDLSIFANDGPSFYEAVAVPPARTNLAPAHGSIATPAAPLEFMAAELIAPAVKSRIDDTVVLTAARAVLSAGAAVGSGKPKLALEPQEDLNFQEIDVAVPAVEEISDVMQEAEFWISLRDSQRAIEVLEPYATTDHPTSPLPWLYLFELYADSNQRTNYDDLHKRFQRVFNGKIPTWEELEQQPPPVYLRSIEDVPHICDKIVALWWTEQSVSYLESLLLDDRDGNRIGFDLPVYRELMFLIGIAYEIQKSKKFIKPALGSPGWTIAA